MSEPLLTQRSPQTRHHGIILIAVDANDYRDWCREYPELAPVTTIITTSWAATAPTRAGMYASTYLLTERAQKAPDLGGAEIPRWVRLATLIAERDRPAYLRVPIDQPQHIDPDCQAGKHRACPGYTFDDRSDLYVPCECVCHDPNGPTP
jgi:hypothetical protein